MTRPMHLPLFPFCALLLSVTACETDLSAAGQQVHMGKVDPEGCRELGRVHGSGGGGAYTSSDDKMQSAENEIRNNAAALGANYVAMDALGGDARGMTLSGRAFHCDQLPGDRLPQRQQTIERLDHRDPGTE